MPAVTGQTVGMNRNHFERWLAIIALATFVLALAWASHSSAWTPRQALAIPGAMTVPGAGTFNLLAFGVPGAMLLVAALSRRWRSREHCGMTAGIALWLLAIAGLAWLALGDSPIDADDLAGAGSQRHAALWMLWLIAVSAAAVALIIGVGKEQRGLAAVLALLWLVVILILPALLGGWAQILAALAWMTWPLTPITRIRIMIGSARP